MILQDVLYFTLRLRHSQNTLKTEVIVVMVLCRKNTKGIPSSHLLYTDTLSPKILFEFLNYSLYLLLPPAVILKLL